MERQRVTHNGLRQTHYNIFLTAQAMKPFWGATVIDGYEGMEGNGPASGHTGGFARGDCLSRLHRGRPGWARSDGHQSKWLGYLISAAISGLANTT